MASLAPIKAEVLQLLRAAKVGDVATVKHLITKLDINTRGPSDYPWLQRTPLMIAAEYNRQDVVKMLLNKGADLNARDENGRSALSIALYKGNEELAGALITAGADIKITDNVGDSLLHRAARGNCSSVIGELLVKAGLDVNIVNKDGWSALSIALWKGNEELVGALITAGADIKITDNDGDSLLHDAAWGNCSSVIGELLVKAGLDVNIVNKAGETPLDIAIKYGNSSTVHWFVKYYNIDLSNYDEDTQQGISRLVKQKEEENLSESSSSQLVPSPQCVRLPDEILAQKPNMKILDRIVIPKIKVEWKRVAYSMDYDVQTISAIEKESCNLQDGCLKLFKDWLTTSNGPSPKTWKTLLGCIEDVEVLTAAVEEIKAELVKEINVPVSDKRKPETS